MLAYFLAIAIGLGSLALYLTAFFSPQTHRQDDFLWSGVGLFYALVLWLCAGQIRGSVLLGQGAAVSLLLVFGWQTLKLRRAIAYPERQADLEGFSLTQWLRNRMGKKPKPAKPAIPQPEAAPTVPEAVETGVAEAAAAVTPTLETEREGEPEITAVEEAVEMEIEAVTEAKSETQKKKGFSLKDLLPFSKGKPEAKAETIAEALDAIEAEEIEEEWEVEETPEAAAPDAIEPPPIETTPATELTETVTSEKVTIPENPDAIAGQSEEVETDLDQSSGEPETIASESESAEPAASSTEEEKGR